MPSSDSSFQDTEASVAKPNKTNKAKAVLYGVRASNVVEVVKRFGDSNKKLVRKWIAHFSSNGYWMGDFDGEALACKMLTKWSKENENEEIFKHIAKVVDYHYGLASLYVTYEEADGKKLGARNPKLKMEWKSKLGLGYVKFVSKS